MNGFYDTIEAGKKVRHGKDYPYFIEDGTLYYGFWTGSNSTSKLIGGFVVDGEAIAYGDFDFINYTVAKPVDQFAEFDNFSDFIF